MAKDKTMLRALIFAVIGVFISSSAMATCGASHGDKTATSTESTTAETTTDQTIKPKS